jgi:feruloyl esterase
MLIALLLSSMLAGEACGQLRDLKIANTTVTLAELVSPGRFPPPRKRDAAAFKKLPAFCRVAAILRPSSDSEIKIEVWMPESGWNGRLESVGNGAWAGTISYSAMATALAAGFATASTDTGHTGNNPNFIPGHPEKIIDFGYRAVHEMTVAAKVIIDARYGNGPKFSYWSGCSTGGRQALSEAEKYPKDYDGILAGAPAIAASRLQGMQVWASQTVHKDASSYIPKNKYPLIHNAVLEQCDAIDGLKDGVLEDPTKCKFDPKVLACNGNNASSCLTAPQVQAAAKLYSGPRNAVGKPLFAGLQPGSELGWATLAGPKPMSLATDVYKYLVLNNPNWDFKTLNPDTDFPLAEKAVRETLDAADPNLKPFGENGGKLILYHGWSDPGIPPMNTVEYYKEAVNVLGGEPNASKSLRLFMVPGMNHCQGGNGTDKFNGITALSKWVENGIAPDQIPASHQTAGKVDRTRPLCPYPQTAVYKGSGSTDEAANFMCK